MEYGTDLGASIVRFNQSEHRIWTIWTNESAPLCLQGLAVGGTVEVSPPEIGGKQLLVLAHFQHVLRSLWARNVVTRLRPLFSSTCYAVVEIFKIDV